MAKLLKIAKTKDVPPGQAAPFTIEGQKIALFNVEGTYYAIGDTCTHRGGPLSEGDVQGTRVTCPWHGADFDLKTGAVLGQEIGRRRHLRTHLLREFQLRRREKVLYTYDFLDLREWEMRVLDIEPGSAEAWRPRCLAG